MIVNECQVMETANMSMDRWSKQNKC